MLVFNYFQDNNSSSLYQPNKLPCEDRSRRDYHCHLNAILKSTLDKDKVKLEWHPDLPIDSIDPLGMEDEFRSNGPL